jgi:hypothetical protein
VFSSFSFYLCVPYITCTVVNKVLLYLGCLFQPLPPENEAQDVEPTTPSTPKSNLIAINLPLGEHRNSQIRNCHHLQATFVVTPLWAKCEGESHTPKSGKLESSGTPKNSEFDRRGHISLHMSVLGFIGKVLKCRCPKRSRMSHLDICNPSYG